MTIALIRTIILYLIIIFAIKMMGKRQISDLQTSELVITIMISNIAAIPMENTDQPLLASLIPIAILVCAEITISFLMLKSLKFRQIICGKPMIVVSEGKIQQKTLKYLRLSVEDLIEQLRQMDVFSIDDVWFAIMETNGTMSVMKKSEKQPPDAMTLGVEVPPGQLEAVVVSDGMISTSSLKICGLSEKWIYTTLQEENIALENVFMMTANKDKKFNIIKKEIHS